MDNIDSAVSPTNASHEYIGDGDIFDVTVTVEDDDGGRATE